VGLESGLPDRDMDSNSIVLSNIVVYKKKVTGDQEISYELQLGSSSGLS
jgi:hypothetical protein